MTLLEKIPGISIQRLARFLAVVAIAIAAGHLMQTLAVRKPVDTTVAATGAPQNIVQLSAGTNRAESVVTVTVVAVPILTAPVRTTPEIADVILVSSMDTVVAQEPLELAVTNTCPIDLALTAEPGAMINIGLSAPCHAMERVVLRHAGLAVTARLGDDGSLSQSLPALISNALVEVMFADGNTVDARLEVAQAATLRRFVVQWQGPDAFALHGLEDGADYGQPGDISAVNLGQPESGSLVLLGEATVDMPLLAQVYTYPAFEGRSTEIVVEAVVTETTCGQDLLGEIIESQADSVNVTELTMAMPECSGIGDILVLKNLASDLKIAAN